MLDIMFERKQICGGVQ